MQNLIPAYFQPRRTGQLKTGRMLTARRPLCAKIKSNERWHGWERERWHVHGWERERGGNISASERVVPPVATARVLSACAPGELVTQATAHFCLNSAYVSTVHNALQCGRATFARLRRHADPPVRTGARVAYLFREVTCVASIWSIAATTAAGLRYRSGGGSSGESRR